MNQIICPLDNLPCDESCPDRYTDGPGCVITTALELGAMVLVVQDGEEDCPMTYQEKQLLSTIRESKSPVALLELSLREIVARLPKPEQSAALLRASQESRCADALSEPMMKAKERLEVSV